MMRRQTNMISRSLSLTPHLKRLSLLALVSASLMSCGPRFKTAQMVAYEQQRATPELDRLKRDCPDLINDSLRYYERAKELHEDNEPEESEHYVTMASITWRTAERRSAFLAHRQRMSAAKQRYERAQLLFADTQRRKDALLNMQSARQQQSQQALTQSLASEEQRQAQEAALKTTLEEALNAKKSADEVNANKHAAALYSKGLAALKGVDQSVRMKQLTSALKLAKGAAKDFQSAQEAATPAFERERAQQDAVAKMQELLTDAQALPSTVAKQEARGVVVSMSGLFRRGKLIPSQRRVINELAALINRYPGLRVMVEAHTFKQRQRQQALKLTEGMAQEVKAILLPLLTDPDIKLNTLGRGDYAPIVANPRSLENERIDVVFFTPRVD
jgi:outer membrane protein OmpA-like peptidoglycan-associated protein